jgi:site-specific recombinase XerD
MMRRRRQLPSYRLHKATGQAVVTLNGRDHYLGRHGSQGSRDAYDRLTAQWLAGGRQPLGLFVCASPTPNAREHDSAPAPDPRTRAAGLKVNDLILAYWRHAEIHYRDADRKPTQELSNIQDALRPLRKQYGNTWAAEFGPLALRSLQKEMIRSGLCRTTVNARINRIRRVFKWAVGFELIPPAVYQALQAVPGLQRGRTEAREPNEISPVPIERVDATLPYLNPVVRAMVRIQLLTGCRTGGVITMRGCGLTLGEPNWVYRPSRHKTKWRGKDRVIILGPKAREILREFLDRDTEAYLFDPRDAIRAHRASQISKQSSRPGRIASSERRTELSATKCADHYDRRSYRQAIVRACDRAFPHPSLSKIKPKKLTADQRNELRNWQREHRWSPLQLRHTAGTLIRARYGLEASQVVLGHSRADVTQLYAERDLFKAHAVMAEIG